MKARARQAMPRGPDSARLRAALVERLRARLGEMEAAVLTRVQAIPDSRERGDPEYVQGLRAAVNAAVEYSVCAVERGEDRLEPIPTSLRSQARLAARGGVALDTVFRRYSSGYTLLGNFVIEEAVGVGIAGADLERLLRDQAAFFDRVLTGVSEEYRREAESRPCSSENERRTEKVRRLLRGESADAGDLAYDLDSTHLALALRGPEAARAVRELAAPLDVRLLLVQPAPDTTWAWLGARRLDLDRLDSVLAASPPPHLALARGEPADGLAGWRLSHRQALAALPIARPGTGSVVRYADVALLAAALEDDLLATSLRRLYLAPLEGERDGGEVLRATLRAYLAAGHHTTAAAAALGVSRQAVGSRLRTVEDLIGRSLASCAPQVAVALQLEELCAP